MGHVPEEAEAQEALNKMNKMNGKSPKPKPKPDEQTLRDQMATGSKKRQSTMAEMGSARKKPKPKKR